MNRYKLAPVLVLCGLAFGCGGSDKPPAYANVSGSVNFDGKPLPKGTITFSTDGRPPSVMDIVDGKFNGQAMIGSNKINVSAKHKGEKTTALPPQAEAQMKAYAQGQVPGAQASGKPVEMDVGMVEMMPPEWAGGSKQTRVVEAGNGNNFEFNIKSK